MYFLQKREINTKVYKNMKLNGFGHLTVCNKVLQDFHEVQKRDDVLFSPTHRLIFAMIWTALNVRVRVRVLHM